MSVGLLCTYCGAEYTFDGRPSELQQAVAIDVGHVMPTLRLAVEHVVCNRCDRTRLVVSSAGIATPPGSVSLTPV